MMNLPHPFQDAVGIQPNAHGSISLIDDQGKSLARLPLATAFELSPEAEGVGYGDGHGFGHGYGHGCGDGFGDDVGDGDGSGKSK